MKAEEKQKQVTQKLTGSSSNSKLEEMKARITKKAESKKKPATAAAVKT